ncbi:hypothetical protein Tco_0022665, partial [Tanacetum coccineum]
VIFITVSTVVCSGIAREFFVARTVGTTTVNRDRHCAYHPVASIGGRSLEPAAIMLLCI